MMKYLVESTALGAGALIALASGAERGGQEIHLRAGAEEHQQPVLRPGARRLQEGREGARRRRSSASISAPASTAAATSRRRSSPTSSPRRSTASRVSPANAAAMAAALQGAKAGQYPGPDLGLRPAREGQGPARRLCRHAQLRDRRQPRQARHADQAEGRHDLHPVGRRGRGQPQRAHAGHPRHARRQEERRSAGRPADRPERLEGSRRLPALHE